MAKEPDTGRERLPVGTSRPVRVDLVTRGSRVTKSALMGQARPGFDTKDTGLLSARAAERNFGLIFISSQHVVQVVKN
jgi:hypothetical protein